MAFARVERDDATAIVWLDQPDSKLNTISTELIEEFSHLLDSLEKDQDLAGVILISAKPDCFVAGADIRKFADLAAEGKAEEASREGSRILGRMAAFPRPFVAAIHGSALGGGLELALACHYRIATQDPKTVLGQPEVKLGLIPGAGGTQRLPRLIGLRRSLPYLLMGGNIYPSKAYRLGLVDELIHPPGLLDAAKRAVRDLGRSRRRRSRLSLPERLLESTSWGRGVICRKARERVQKQTRGNYPAPLRLIDCVQVGLDEGMEAGLALEAKAFGELMQTAESKRLVELFFAINAASKMGGDSPVSVQRLGILGAGFMGAGIAQVTAIKGTEVLLKDVSREALGRAEKSIYGELSGRVRKGAMTAFQRDRVMSRVHATTDYGGFEDADLVIEAVFEDLDLKREILSQVEEAAPKAVFASNTSAIPIGQIGAQSRRPEQVIGMHYFSPVAKMPLLEIVCTDKTADWVRSAAIALGVRQGKTVIVVNDGPGFYTTRILSPMLNEALLLLEAGAAIEDLDRVMMDTGFPVGPAALMDEVGIDVGAHVYKTLSPVFAARGLPASDKMKVLVAAGYQGRKNGRGFYRYAKKKGRKKEVNAEIYSHFGGPERKPFTDTEIKRRLGWAMINEAVLCLQEKILTSPRDGDLGAVLGLGFPPFLGGPFRFIDAIGPDEALRRLEDLCEQHGDRFKPAPLLREMARGK